MYVCRPTNNFETCPFVNTCDIFYGLPTGAHGATDVTGFGLLGHAQNLASAQKASVSFRIHTLPGTYLYLWTTIIYEYKFLWVLLLTIL